MSKRRPPFTDDAGQPLRSISFKDLPDQGQRAMKRLLKTAGRAVRGDAAQTFRTQAIGLVVGVALLVAFGFVRQTVQLPSSIDLPVFVLLITLIVIANRVIASRVGRGMRRAGLARTMASHGFCGGCGYDLRKQAADQTGLVLCPECGAKWSAARLAASPVTAAAEHAWDPLGRGHGRMNRTRRLTHDDRGALVRLIRSHPRFAPAVARQRWTPAQRQTVAAARRRSLGWRLLATFPALLMLGMAAFVFISVSPSEGVSTGLLGAAFPFTLAGAIVAMLSTNDFGVNSDAFVVRVRDGGLCPACGVPLDLDNRDADGFCICLQCRSSWKPGLSRTPAADPADAGSP
ncbi:MAG: hypothetical protein AAF108_10705 [Planctomycetota bacterium]